MGFLNGLFDTSGFPARWHCGSGWTDDPWIGWLHILSDLGVWSAYLAIPLVLIYFTLRRKDLPFRKIFLLFGAFILACGTTHLMEAIIFWWPAYRLAGLIKLLTAIVSWATVFALVQVVPRVLTLRSPEELQREVEARKKAEQVLQQTNDQLETRIQDRTAELANANGKLMQEREWFRTTLASIGDAVIATDTEGKVTFLNLVAQSLTNWREDEAKGQPLEAVFKIVDEETRQPVENPAFSALNEGVIVGLVDHTILIAKDGTERAIDDSAAPIRDANEQIVGAVLVCRDITERKRAENDLIRLTQASEQQRRIYETALSNTADFNYVFDLQGRFVYINRALLALWGKVFDEAVGKNFFELDYPPPLAERLQCQIQAVIDTRQSLTDETPYANGKGERQYEYIFVPVLGADGAVEAVAGSTRDITERKRAEEALREADRRKNEFLAVLAHELRNPLAPITSALELMRISGGKEEEADPLREMMERQIKQMVHLIDDLLDLSRITSGKIVLRKECLNLPDVVKSALEISRPLIDEARHELVVTMPMQTLQMEGDGTRLAQVLSNLLANSAKYTPEGGRIWISVSRDDQEAVIRVRDTGLGIPSEMLPLIFQMFTQVDRNMGRSQGGLGIGLALVRSIVEMHNGTVEARSDGPGKGSEFVVRLPLSPDAPNLPEVDGEQNGWAMAGTPSRRRILVVDDNKDSAETLARLLGITGNDTRIAHDGPSALAAAADFRPHVVLLDIGLPGMSGHDVARRMRQMPEVKDAVLVAQTGWGQDEDKRQSEDAGFNAHLVKPVDIAELRQLLAELPTSLD